MASQLIAPENARVCSESGFFALLLALAYPRFDSPCQISLRPVQSVAPVGQKAEKSARLYRQYHFALRATLAVTRNQKYHLN